MPSKKDNLKRGDNKQQDKTMSEHFPECPSKFHSDCKKFYDPEVCAIARKEKVCLWKHPESKKEHTDFKEVVKRIKEGSTL